MQVNPPVQHRLVAPPQFNIIPQAHDNLARWSINANLGKTVYEVVGKFMQEPPTIITIQPMPIQPQLQAMTSQSALQPIPQLQAVTSQTQLQPTSQPSFTNPVSKSEPQKESPRFQPPPVPSSFPELQRKT